MDEYFCPNCGAILNDQYGFDPDKGTWTCTECGTHLMDDDIYDGDTFEGVAWYCDDCGALLNRQSGFSDSYGYWECTNCGHRNGITEDDIVNKGPQCPVCDSYLKNQSCYSEYSDDWTCDDCGAKLHRNYSWDEYEVVREEESLECPNCGSELKGQYAFSDWINDYTCQQCGAKLHREYSADKFEVADEDDGPTCPNCGDQLNSQSCYNEYEDDWVCEVCGVKLHREYSYEPYEEVEGTEEDDRRNSRVTKSCHNKKEEKESSTKADAAYKHNWMPNEVPNSELRKIRMKAFLFKKKRIRIGYDSEALLHRNYEYVRMLLRNSAFNNIKCIPIRDIYVGSKYVVGEVEQIVVGGSQYFECSGMVPYDDEIIITYHEKKEFEVPFSSRYCRKKSFVQIGDKFREVGFTNIQERALKDLITGWVVKNGSVEKITIGGKESFKKGAVHKYDIKIVIEYHTFKKNTWKQ